MDEKLVKLSPEAVQTIGFALFEAIQNACEEQSEASQILIEDLANAGAALFKSVQIDKN